LDHLHQKVFLFLIQLETNRPSCPSEAIPSLSSQQRINDKMVRRLLLALAIAQASAFAPAKLPVSTSRSTLSTVGAPIASSVVAPRNQALLQDLELPEKLYIPKEKEMPKVLGGLKIGLRQLVVITGASSGLGLSCAVELAKTGRYFVVMACRDIEKAKAGELMCC
jgi:hypothetical protein